VLGNELIAVGKIARGVSPDALRTGHKHVYEIVHDDRDVDSVDGSQRCARRGAGHGLRAVTTCARSGVRTGSPNSASTFFAIAALISGNRIRLAVHNVEH
jgi:hypothetical protein